MSPTDRRLVRHLMIAVAVKLVVLVALWWTFVRDSHVPVNTEHAASQMLAAPAAMPGARP